MAEVTGFRNNALPYPCIGVPWGMVFPILDNTGALVSGAAGLDSEISLNGNTFADCANEATEIGSSGMYYLLLTENEVAAAVVSVVVKTSTTDAKTTPMVLYPRVLANVRSGTAAGGDPTYITLDSGASSIDKFYEGMIVTAAIDGNIESRLIYVYDGANKRAYVPYSWNVTPDSDDTFTISRPDGVFMQTANTTVLDGTLGAGNAAADALLGRNVAGGSSTGRLVKEALYALRNKWTNAAGTYTVYETDDSTTSWTSTNTSDPTAEPITGSDPS